MKDKIKFELNNTDSSIITRALSDLRNTMIEQDIPVDMVDNVILKVNKRSKISLDKCERDIILKALNSSRIELKDKQENHTDINNIMLKIMECTNTRTPIKEVCER